MSGIVNPAISEFPISDFGLDFGQFQPASGQLTLQTYEPTSVVNQLPVFSGLQTVISQYANSPVILSLIQSFNDSTDQTNDFNLFINQIWQISSAVGYGLDVWGRIVGVSRYLFVEDAFYFGMKGFDGEASGDVLFDPHVASVSTSGTSPFYTGEPLTTNFALTDDAYRTIILAKAYVNITNGSAAAINKIMLLVFADSGGNAYIADNGSMQVTYTLDFTPTALQMSILFQSGVFPQPTGMQIDYSTM